VEPLGFFFNKNNDNSVIVGARIMLKSAFLRFNCGEATAENRMTLYPALTEKTTKTLLRKNGGGAGFLKTKTAISPILFELDLIQKQFFIDLFVTNRMQ
jgi:hypothetical protein